MRVAAGIVTYNPAIEDLRASIPLLMRQVEILIVVDNGSENVKEIIELSERYPKMALIRNDQNLGIAPALNSIFDYAIRKGFDWVLTLDDDSEIPSLMVEGYARKIQQVNRNGEPVQAKIGIVCPMLKNRKDGTVFHSKRSRDECITSGSLTNVAAWKAIGGFDDWLFIDGVDFDFSRRLYAAGYQIVECPEVIMPHQIGESRSINLGFKHPIAWNHAPFRWYYIERNSLYIDAKLGTYTLFKAFVRLMSDMCIVLLWEKDKVAKISAMIRGWRDGKRKIRAMHIVQ